MTHDFTPEQIEEFFRLYAEHVRLTDIAGEMLKRHGMESALFIEADAAADKTWAGLREMQGMRSP